FPLLAVLQAVRRRALRPPLFAGHGGIWRFHERRSTARGVRLPYGGGGGFDRRQPPCAEPNHLRRRSQISLRPCGRPDPRGVGPPGIAAAEAQRGTPAD